jgi:phage terminase large subunit-like protein
MQGEGIPVAEFPQTISHFSEPTKTFEKTVLAHKFRHGANPILRWMLDCCSIKADSNGNVRPVKPDRLKDSRRIDGIVAAIMGLSTISAAPDLTGFLENPLIIDVSGPAEKRGAIARNQ